MDFRAFIEYFNTHDQFSIQNGIQLLTLQKGYAEVSMQYKPTYTNFMGTLHGGALFTLADVAAGCAIISHGFLCVTLTSSIHYLQTPSSETITAYAQAIYNSPHIGVSNVQIKDTSKTLLCTCTSTMYMTGKAVHF